MGLELKDLCLENPKPVNYVPKMTQKLTYWHFFSQSAGIAQQNNMHTEEHYCKILGIKNYILNY